MQNNGEIELVGVVHNTGVDTGVCAISAINTYYGRPDVPVGAYKGSFASTERGVYVDDLCKRFPNDPRLRNSSTAPDAVAVYRSVLASQVDHSVVIASIGFTTNLEALLQSGPDAYSAMSGTELIAAKVSQVAWMGGMYPHSGNGTLLPQGEWNFAHDGLPFVGASTYSTMQHWPEQVPRVFSGFQVGARIFTGGVLTNGSSPANPCRAAFMNRQGPGKNRESWDPATVLYAVRGLVGGGWKAQSSGRNLVDPHGLNRWVADGSRHNQSYLLQEGSPAAVAKTIDTLLLQPRRKKTPIGKVELERDQVSSDAPIPVGKLSADAKAKLTATRKGITRWALVVDGGAAQDECDTATRGSCDLTFWNGLLCSNPSAGPDVHRLACESDLPRSQSPDGMLWRSPWEAKQQNSTNPDFFSRDQGLATLASLTNTKNKTLYEPWLHYIVTHGGYMCPDKFDCRFTTPFWCTADKVATHASLSQPPADIMVPKLGAGVCNNDHLLVYTAVNVNENGSALHLAALDVYIRRQIGDWDSLLQKAADKLHSRDPENAFFRWLSQGASDDLVELILSQIPKHNATSAVGKRKQWAFVRQDSEQAWAESMGWDYLFLIDHLLAAPSAPAQGPSA